MFLSEAYVRTGCTLFCNKKQLSVNFHGVGMSQLMNSGICSLSPALFASVCVQQRLKISLVAKRYKMPPISTDRKAWHTSEALAAELREKEASAGEGKKKKHKKKNVT